MKTMYFAIATLLIGCSFKDYTVDTFTDASVGPAVDFRSVSASDPDSGSYFDADVDSTSNSVDAAPQLSCQDVPAVSAYQAVDEWTLARNGCVGYVNCNGFPDRYTTTNSIETNGSNITDFAHTHPGVANFDIVCAYQSSESFNEDGVSGMRDVYCCQE
jgi:hypothetical protein